MTPAHATGLFATARQRPQPGAPEAARATGYRPEIDGLRALAVLAVMAFHAGFAWMPGGYVGVDVFFVVSGFLITRLLLAEMAGGTFSFGGFYLRRLRRLAPAFVVTLMLTTFGAVALLPTDELRLYGADLRDTALAISNFRFAGALGYFETNALPRLLLHTWSLAVEEQYYLAGPLLVWLGFRFGGARLVLLLAAAAFAASLAAAAVAVGAMPQAAYFWTPFRVWELTLGGMLVFLPGAIVRSRGLREGLACGGLAAIIVAFVTFEASTGVPGPSALLPCLGAAAIIAARGSDVSRLLLAHRAAVTVGLMSYSLYLVHWPVISFFAIAAMHPQIDPGHRIAALIISLILAALMYRFVETPFRRGAWSVRRKRLAVALTVACLLATAGIGQALRASDGLPGRLVTDIGHPDDPFGSCLRQIVCPLAPGALEAPHLVVIGDSNALQLAAAMTEWAQPRGLRPLLVWGPSCFLVSGIDKANHHHARCEATRAAVTQTLAAHPRTPVLYAQFWLDHIAALEEGKPLQDYLAAIARNHPLILFGQVPYGPPEFQHCGRAHAFLLDERACDSHVMLPITEQVNASLRALSSALPGPGFVDPTDTQCRHGRCDRLFRGESAFLNANHLSRQGAMLHLEGGLGVAIDKALRR